ncbi:MAG: hypothetical protein V2B18_08360 [Pseudomonadota bacterium]
MDEIQKNRIRIKHWITHNDDHLKGYEEVAATLRSHGQNDAADKIENAAEFIGSANRAFEEALECLGPEDHSHTEEKGHSHHHHHGGKGHTH